MIDSKFAAIETEQQYIRQAFKQIRSDMMNETQNARQASKRLEETQRDMLEKLQALNNKIDSLGSLGSNPQESQQQLAEFMKIITESMK